MINPAYPRLLSNVQIAFYINNLSQLIESQSNNCLVVRIFKSKSKYELKDIGKLKMLKDAINSLFANVMIVRASSWEIFYNSIDCIREIGNLNNSCDKADISDDLYFKGIAERYIFFLLELDGKERLDKLKINKTHFNREAIAKEWRNSMAKIIHPDVCNHSKSGEAMAEVNALYKEMIQ